MGELPGRTRKVLVVGAGPVGLAVAASWAGTATRSWWSTAGRRGEYLAGFVVHARTLEMLERIGVSERLVGLGIQERQFASATATGSSCRSVRPAPTNYPFTLMVPQCRPSRSCSSGSRSSAGRCSVRTPLPG